MKGIVNSYSENKGFGFITQEDGKKLSFYRSSIQMNGYKRLNVGDRVSFDVVQTIGGPEAKNISKLE